MKELAELFPRGSRAEQDLSGVTGWGKYGSWCVDPSRSSTVARATQQSHESGKLRGPAKYSIQTGEVRPGKARYVNSKTQAMDVLLSPSKENLGQSSSTVGTLHSAPLERCPSREEAQQFGGACGLIPHSWRQYLN